MNWNRSTRSASATCILALGSLAFCVFIAQLRYGLALVSGESMLPTFQNHEFLIVDKRAYLKSAPLRGDIVVAKYRREFVVKRVVGLPEETVQVRNGRVLVNEKPVAENHAIEPGRLSVEKGTLLPGKFALLGDNRSISSSQIVHAIVSRDSLFGRVVGSFRLWPIRRQLSSGLDGS